MTSAGKQSLEDELKRLVGQIQQELDASLVSAQKIFADTGDDSDLNIAKDRQNFNNFRIGELKERCSKAEVIDDSKVSRTEVQFGSKVVLESAKRESLTLKIVGIDEANFLKEKVSVDSPLAQHLLGKHVGDKVELNTANGKMDYTIVELSV